MNLNLSLESILFFLNRSKIVYKYYGIKSLVINNFAALAKPTNYSIFFARNSSMVDINYINSLVNSIIIINNFTENISINKLVVSDPHKVFFMLIKEFLPNITPPPTISPSSIILSKFLGKNLFIGANTFIDEKVIIEDNVQIQNNVSIVGNVSIGSNTKIEAGVCIGVDGYGHYKDDDNINVRVDHIAGVKIGKNVIIGSNTTISRGALSDTIIEDNVRIDNLCHIAHNVIIKSRSMLTACVEVSGSSIIEEDVWIGPNSSIINGITIGKGSLVGIGSVVIKNVPKNCTVFGNPAKIIFNK